MKPPRICGQAHPWLCEDCRAREKCYGKKEATEKKEEAPRRVGEVVQEFAF